MRGILYIAPGGRGGIIYIAPCPCLIESDSDMGNPTRGRTCGSLYLQLVCIQTLARTAYNDGCDFCVYLQAADKVASELQALKPVAVPSPPPVIAPGPTEPVPVSGALPVSGVTMAPPPVRSSVS